MQLIKSSVFVCCLAIFTPLASAQSAIVKGYADIDHCVPVRPDSVVEDGKPKAVSFAFLIGEDGKVQKTKVTKSSGNKQLDEAALVVFENCKFYPSLAYGQPQISWVMLTYRW